MNNVDVSVALRTSLFSILEDGFFSRIASIQTSEIPELKHCCYISKIYSSKRKEEEAASETSHNNKWWVSHIRVQKYFFNLLYISK